MRGVEALVRWEHPERGWILPSEFIGIAEDSGLIADVGDFVLRDACTQMQRWGSTLDLHADIFGLGATLGLRMIAEGVEREQQRAVLLSLGCTLAQGYLFARPVTAAEISTMLARRRSTGAIVPLRIVSGAADSPGQASLPA